MNPEGKIDRGVVVNSISAEKHKPGSTESRISGLPPFVVTAKAESHLRPRPPLSRLSQKALNHKGTKEAFLVCPRSSGKTKKTLCLCAFVVPFFPEPFATPSFTRMAASRIIQLLVTTSKGVSSTATNFGTFQNQLIFTNTLTNQITNSCKKKMSACRRL